MTDLEQRSREGRMWMADFRRRHKARKLYRAGRLGEAADALSQTAQITRTMRSYDELAEDRLRGALEASDARRARRQRAGVTALVASVTGRDDELVLARARTDQARKRRDQLRGSYRGARSRVAERT